MSTSWFGGATAGEIRQVARARRSYGDVPRVDQVGCRGCDVLLGPPFRVPRIMRPRRARCLLPLGRRWLRPRQLLRASIIAVDRVWLIRVGGRSPFWGGRPCGLGDRGPGRLQFLCDAADARLPAPLVGRSGLVSGRAPVCGSRRKPQARPRNVEPAAPRDTRRGMNFARRPGRTPLHPGTGPDVRFGMIIELWKLLGADPSHLVCSIDHPVRP